MPRFFLVVLDLHAKTEHLAGQTKYRFVTHVILNDNLIINSFLFREIPHI